MRAESPQERRLARALAGLSVVFFGLVAGWELFGPLPGGHLGNVAGSSIGGENMLGYRLFAAITSYLETKPSPASYYCHHPYGVFALHAAFHAVFGHGFATTRLPALLLAPGTAALVYALGRRLFGALPAALGTALFVLLPIDLAFAQFASLEALVMATGLVFAIGTVDVLRTGRRGPLLVALLGALLVCHADFCGFVLVGVVGGLEILRVYVLGARVPRRLAPSHARYTVLVLVIAIGTLLLYLAAFAKAGQLHDLVGAYHNRAAGNEAGLRALLTPRRLLWLLGMIPLPALVVGLVGVLLSAIERVRGAPEHAVVVGFFVMTMVQVLVFRSGADVHIFWPHTFGVSAALGLAAIVSAARAQFPDDGAGRAGRGAEEAWPRHVITGAALVLLVVIGRMGLVQLVQSRLTGGRFDDGGRYIGVDQDKAGFARWAGEKVRKSLGESPRRTPGTNPVEAHTKRPVIALHPSFPRSWPVEYGLDAVVRETAVLTALSRGEHDRGRFALVDARRCSPAELVFVAHHGAISAQGPFWLVDRAGEPSGFEALRLDERSPTVFERAFVTGTDLVRTFGDEPDALHAWEWRDHLGLPATLASFEPRSPEEARVRHNLAVARGEPPSPEHRALAERLAPQRLDLTFDDGLVLLGYEVERGAATVVTLLWETPPTFVARDRDFLVRSRVVAAPRGWLAPIDFYEKEVAPPDALRPGLWKPGRLYVQRFVAMKRVGKEVYQGVFSSREGPPPKLLSGELRVPLFTLE